MNRSYRMAARVGVRLVAVVLALVLAAAPAAAQGGPAESGRPRVGLVLSGGGAKGGAHLGVLRVLEEMRVPVDCIAGTSIGALVGGGYAAGLPLDEMEAFVLGIDWKAVIGGVGHRQLEPIEQKRGGVTYSNKLELGVVDGNVRLPSALVNTNSIDNLLREYVAGARKVSDFDQLPIPFRAVATDMVGGEMVVLGTGDLATALRASMALPGAFAPVLSEGLILSDGGMVRNIPVDVARDLCADVVIVVDLVEAPPSAEDLSTATALLSRSNDVMFSVNEKIQLATLGPRDILLSVPMGDIGTGDFDRMGETIPLGLATADAARDRLAALSVPEAEYTAWREEVTRGQAVEVRVAEIEYQGLERVNPDYLRQEASVRPGDLVDGAKLGEDAQRIGALRDIETVGYRVEGDAESAKLVWLPAEKRIGPDYLKFDIGVYGTGGGDLAFTLYADHRRTWLTDRGTEWRNEFQLGRLSFLRTGLYAPFDVPQRYFSEPMLFAERSIEEIYDGNERIARYQFTDLGAAWDLGVNFNRFLQARAGYRYARRSADVDTGPPIIGDDSAYDAGLSVDVIYDSRDTRFAPTDGLAMAFAYRESDEDLGGDRDWQRAELGLGLTLPLFRRDVLWVTAAGGSRLGSDLPFDRKFAIGGPSSFPGLELGEVRAGEYVTAGTSYLWRIREILPVRGDALYLGGRVQAGYVSDRAGGGKDRDIYGGALFLTGRTLVGPLTFGLGRASLDSWSLWLAVGRPIGYGTILEQGIFR